MTTKEKSKQGRRRSFDVETALEIGQRLFHERGYEGTGIAALTEALGINPPSFYMAFGSKAAFFERILDRYMRIVLSGDDILRSDRGLEEAFTDLLDRTARYHAKDPETRGCLVLEAARGTKDSEGSRLACDVAAQRWAELRDFAARSNPTAADAVADYMLAVMSGLSASARQGLEEYRLLAIARASATGLKAILQ